LPLPLPLPAQAAGAIPGLKPWLGSTPDLRFSQPSRAFARLFPDSAEGGFLPWGRSKRVSAMTRKAITLEFLVPTVLSIAIAVVLSIGAVYLTNIYLGPIEQAEAHYSAAGRH
jgi:hypothetical protein